MREWRRAVVAVVGLAFAADRRRAWFAVVAWPICGVLGTFSSLWLKLLVDGAAGGDGRQVLVAAGLVAVSASIALSGFFISLTAMTRVREEVDREIDQRLIALTGGVLGVAHQENPEYLDRLELLRTGRGELADVVSALSSVPGPPQHHHPTEPASRPEATSNGTRRSSVLQASSSAFCKLKCQRFAN